MTRPPWRTLLTEKAFWALHLAGLAFFFRPLFGGEVFFFRDLSYLHIPFVTQWAEFVKAGEPPFWNHLYHGGFPFLAEVHMTALYPGNLLALILPPAQAVTVSIGLHLLAAAAAAYLLGRVCGLPPAAAFVTGSVFAYCGFSLSQANMLLRTQGLPWIAVHLLFWHLFLVERRRRYFVAALLATTLQLFSGSPTLFLPTLATSLVWALTVRAPGAAVPRWRRAGLWLLLAALTAGLAAPQVLPTLELLGVTARGEGVGLEEFGYWSLHPWRVLDPFLPGFLGPVDRLAVGSYWGYPLTDVGFAFFLSLYAGAITAFLVALGAWSDSPQRRLERALLAIAAVAGVLALGRYLPIFEFLHAYVPGIRLFRYPVKFLIFTLVPAALLAGRGAAAVFSGDRRKLRRLLAGFALVLGPASAFLLLRPDAVAMPIFQQQPAIDGLFRSGLHTAAFAVLALLLVGLCQRRAPAAGPWILAAVLLADLMLGNRGINPTAPRELLTQVPPSAALVRSEVGTGRLYRAPPPETYELNRPDDNLFWLFRYHQEAMHFYTATRYGIPMVFHKDFDDMAPSRSRRLADVFQALPWERRWPLLNAAAVTVLMTTEVLPPPAVRQATISNTSNLPVHLYRNPGAVRRIEWIGVWQTLDEDGDSDDALRLMLAPGFDPRKHAILEAPISAQNRAACEGDAVLELRAWHPGRQVYGVNAPCAGVVVLSETFYPGWEVRIDGEPVPVWRANYAFMASPIPGGEHEVEVRFVPRTFYTGLAVSLGALLVLLAAGALVRTRARD